MRINGKQIALETQELILKRASGDLKLTVCAMSIGLEREFAEVYPRPLAPATVTQHKDGTQKTTYDYDNKDFIAAVNERLFLENIYTVYRVLGADHNIEWENRPTNIESLRKLGHEFASSGIGMGEMAIIMRTAMILSGIEQKAVEKAKESF